MSEQQTQNAPTQDSSLNPGGYSDPRAAFSPKVKEFREAMSLLYIRNNASGRNKFRLKWPDVARHIFGEELIRMDNDGTQDRERRAQLENEAGLRRIEIKTVLAEYEDKSVKSGSLEFDYVGRVLDKFGSTIGQLMYAENIIERVRPGLISKAAQDSADKTQAIHDKQEEADDVLRAKSALMSQESESFDPILSPEETAEKELAEQERMALRPSSQEDNSLSGLHEEMRQSEQFMRMKIEISDDIRPIETEAAVGEAIAEMGASLPQSLDELQTVVEPVTESALIAPVSLPPAEPIQELAQESPPSSIPDAVEDVAVAALEQEIIPAPVVAPAAPLTIQEPEPASIVQEMPVTAPPMSEPQTQESAPSAPTVAAAPLPAMPPIESEKKPRLHIAGLRIKDEQKEELASQQTDILPQE